MKKTNMKSIFMTVYCIGSELIPKIKYGPHIKMTSTKKKLLTWIFLKVRIVYKTIWKIIHVCG